MRHFALIVIRLCLLAVAVCIAGGCVSQVNLAASQALIRRVLPAKAGSFVVEALPEAVGKDLFEVESRGNKIVLRGTSGVAVASALYHYLTQFCHCQITWNGTNLHLPAMLPAVRPKVRKNTPYEYRYYLNYCTFNYSMSWWDWSRWEKEIDWMALHGINMPLALTGEESIWQEVYKQMGFSKAELDRFFCGPAYFSWFWMGNLDAWGGPLPESWMERQKALQQKIVQRERALGMKPVLAAFTGHVPPSFARHFPQSKLKVTNWKNGFADTYILDAADPLFAEIGKRFLNMQTRVYGTDHLYSADTFNENEPPSDEPQFLSDLSRSVFKGMEAADPKAVWVMQGWLFFSDKKFWKEPQIEALLKAVPDDHMIILDLATEIEPVWKRTHAFYGKPWIWNMLHNFGGNLSLFGRIEGVAAGPAEALQSPASGRLRGIGLTPEAIEQNPVLYELMTDHTWRDSAINLDAWLPAYIRNRYGTVTPDLVQAWNTVRLTGYNGQRLRDGTESIITARPTLDSGTRWSKTVLNYRAQDLLPAWDGLIKFIGACHGSDGFQYDLVDITRQVLVNYALPLQRQWVAAYRAHDVAGFERYSKAFLELIDDTETLMATRRDFLLGVWLEQAKSCGTTPAEKALYERNARDLITLWGDAQSPLHEYSCRQWSGLLGDFYKPRWQHFITQLHASLQQNREMDLAAFQKDISQWEWQWVNRQNVFPTKSTGDPVAVALRLYRKYRTLQDSAYRP